MISEFGENTNSYCSFESKETALLHSENGNLQQRVNVLTHEVSGEMRTRGGESWEGGERWERKGRQEREKRGKDINPLLNTLDRTLSHQRFFSVLEFCTNPSLRGN